MVNSTVFQYRLNDLFNELAKQREPQVVLCGSVSWRMYMGNQEIYFFKVIKQVPRLYGAQLVKNISGKRAVGPRHIRGWLT